MCVCVCLWRVVVSMNGCAKVWRHVGSWLREYKSLHVWSILKLTLTRINTHIHTHTHHHHQQQQQQNAHRSTRQRLLGHKEKKCVEWAHMYMDFTSVSGLLMTGRLPGSAEAVVTAVPLLRHSPPLLPAVAPVCPGPERQEHCLHTHTHASTPHARKGVCDHKICKLVGFNRF